MTPFDHLQQFAQIFNRALAELPASQRQILSDLATPHGEALAKAVAPVAPPGTAADPAASTAGESPAVPGNSRLKTDRARQQETVSRLTQENLALHAQLQAMRRKRAGQDTTALIRKPKTK